MKQKKFSANEINKFTYCPYQWYYEKVYTSRVLNEKRQIALQEHKLVDHTNHHFIKGQQHHKNFSIQLSRLWIVFLLCALLIFILYSIGRVWS